MNLAFDGGENHAGCQKGEGELQKLKASMEQLKPITVFVETFRGETREQAHKRYGIDEWREGIIFIDEASEWDKYL
jgi:hypothetical protein